MALPDSIASRLSQATSNSALISLVAEATATLNIERKRYQQQLSLTARQVAISRVELEAQNLRADQLKVLLAKKTSRLHDVEAIAARGSVPQFKLTDLNVEISELVARQEDLRVALAQAERRQVEAEIAQSKVELGFSVEIEKELAATRQDIDEGALAVASLQAVTQGLHVRRFKQAGTEIPCLSFKLFQHGRRWARQEARS